MKAVMRAAIHAYETTWIPFYISITHNAATTPLQDANNMTSFGFGIGY